MSGYLCCRAGHLRAEVREQPESAARRQEPRRGPAHHGDAQRRGGGGPARAGRCAARQRRALAGRHRVRHARVPSQDHHGQPEQLCGHSARGLSPAPGVGCGASGVAGCVRACVLSLSLCWTKLARLAQKQILHSTRACQFRLSDPHVCTLKQQQNGWVRRQGCSLPYMQAGQARMG